MTTTLVIKLSGKLLAIETLQMLSSQLATLMAKTNKRICLVHGGGTTLDHWLSVWGFESRKTHGIRHTPDTQLPVVMGALAGYCNAQLVGSLLSHGLPAVGLTLADAFSSSVILSEKWACYGKVGEITGNNADLLNTLLDHKKVPVLSSIAHHPKEGWFNINADQAAMALATLLKADELWLLSDVDGVLDRDGHVIDKIIVDQTKPLTIPDTVTGGMHIKLLSAAEVVKNSDCSVTIANGHCRRTLQALFSSLSTSFPSLDHRRCGTCICA